MSRNVACRITDDTRFEDEIQGDPEYQRVLGDIGFSRYSYRLGDSTQFVVITCDQRGEVLFGDIVTRDAIFSTYYADGTPVESAIYVGTQRVRTLVGFKSINLTSIVPDRTDRYRPWTEDYRTQLRLELGDVVLPAMAEIRLLSAVVKGRSIQGKSYNVVKCPIQGELQFTRVELMFFYLDTSDFSVGYGPLIIPHRLRWLYDQYNENLRGEVNL